MTTMTHSACRSYAAREMCISFAMSASLPSSQLPAGGLRVGESQLAAEDEVALVRLEKATTNTKRECCRKPLCSRNQRATTYIA